MRRLAWLTGLGVGCVVVAGLAQAQVHVLTAERVHTSDPAHPVAQAIAWDAQGRILAVGGADDLRALSTFVGPNGSTLGGCVVGKALVEGRVSVAEAVAACR